MFFQNALAENAYRSGGPDQKGFPGRDAVAVRRNRHQYSQRTVDERHHFGDPLRIIGVQKTKKTPPVPAASLVIATMPGMRRSSARVDSPLKPNHRSMAPSTDQGRLRAVTSLGGPFSGNRTLQGPMTRSAARAAYPHTLWISVDPAKSTYPLLPIQSIMAPAFRPFQAQWPNTRDTQRPKASPSQADRMKTASTFRWPRRFLISMIERPVASILTAHPRRKL